MGKLWENFMLIVSALTGTLVTTAVSVEKTVQLYENEVDNLHAEQSKRLEEYAREREIILDKFKSSLNSPTTEEPK